MPYSVKGFFLINEDMVQILLTLEVLFTQDSKVEDLFCGASSGSDPSLFFSNYFFSLGFKPVQDDFQHDFARMTDEADSSFDSSADILRAAVDQKHIYFTVTVQPLADTY